MTSYPSQRDPDQQRAVEVRSSSFSGPIPPPHILAQYNAVVPGAAERIIAMAEEQSKHRQGLERTVIQGDSRRADRGQWFGLIIGIGGLFVALLLGLFGNPWVAGIIGVLDIVGLVAVFVRGATQRRDERTERRKDFDERLQKTSSAS